MAWKQGIQWASAAFLEEITARTRRDRVPLSGFFDLTYRCNLRCSHCYVGHLVAQPFSRAAELGKGQIVHLLHDAADSGCLFMTFSGGEPLVRRDFPEIYKAARRLGMSVSIFTNATLVDNSHLEALCEYPPQAVDVSIYGTTEAVYERVSRIPGSFRQAMRGLERLLDRGLPVHIKTMILRDNADEVEAVQALAAKIGAEFRVDPRVMPRLDGDPEPLAQRVEPKRAVAIEMSTDERRRELVRFYERKPVDMAENEGRLDRLYLCGAGIASFHLDPQGNVRPCFLARSVAYNGIRGGFLGAWRAVAAEMDETVATRPSKCVGCENLLLCGYCPGLFVLESGSFSRPPEYICRLGQARREVVNAVQSEVKHAGVR